MKIKANSLQTAIDAIKKEEEALTKAILKEQGKARGVKRKGEVINSKEELLGMLECDIITYDQYYTWCDRLDRVNAKVNDKTNTYEEAINVLYNARISLMYDLREMDADGYVDMVLPEYKEVVHRD